MEALGKVKEIQEAIIQCFKVNPKPLTMGQLRSWIEAKGYDPVTVYQQIRGSCINLPSAYKHREKTPKTLFYDRASRSYRLANEGDSEEHQNFDNHVAVERDESLEDDEQGTRFALESHLRDYLAHNLSSIEEGMQLWTAKPPSVEYPLEGRRIDLLAKDSTGIPVVIELKLNRAYDRVIGQALLYRGLVRRALKQDRVRLVLVAAELTDELKLAAEEVSDVTLFEYSLSMKITKLRPSVD